MLLNSSLSRVHFDLAPLSNDSLAVILRASQNCSVIDIRDLKDLLDRFHFVMNGQVRRLRNVAEELKLSFDGKGFGCLKDLLKDLLGLDLIIR
jgi:hypothetical protein